MTRATYEELCAIRDSVRSVRPILPNVGKLALYQGRSAVECITEAGAYVMKFVIDPGPYTELIVLTSMPGRVPRVGTGLQGFMHEAEEYEYDAHANLPHRPSFGSQSSAIRSEDVPNIIGKITSTPIA